MYTYVFPGQGIQKKGMGKGLFEEFPQLVHEADEILGYSIQSLCLDDQQRLLARTEYAQPAIYVTNALYHLKARQQHRDAPSYLAGHSLGEYNALLVAGAFDFKTGLHLVQRRAQLMAKADGGGMAAVVGITEQQIEQVLRAQAAQNVTIANANAPDQFVLSGAKAELEQLKKIFEKFPGVKAFVPLRTSGAFHSPSMLRAGQEFGEFLENFSFSALTLPVISNVTAAPYPAHAVKDLLAAQISSPVKWLQSIQYLRQAGVTRFVELGEAQVLTPLIEKTLQQPPEHKSVPPQSRVKPASGAALLARIADHCQTHPTKVLQIFYAEGRQETVTGSDLLARVGSLGSALAAQLAPQEKVILFFGQGTEFVTALLACWHANVIAIPTPLSNAAQFAQKAANIEAIIQSSGARYALCHPALKPLVSPLAQARGLQVLDFSQLEPQPEWQQARAVSETDLALVLYTSGSTSQPKGAMLSHATIFNTACCKLWCVSEQSRLVSWLPQFHAFGISFGTLVPLAHGALNVFYAPEDFIQNPLSWFELIDRHQATHTGAPNFVFEFCCAALELDAAQRFSLQSLESLVCGGDLINKRHYTQFVEKFGSLGLKPHVLTPNYGLSEAGPITLKRLGDPLRSVWLDKASLATGHIVKITDEDATSSASSASSVSPQTTARQILSCGETAEDTQIAIVHSESCEPCAPGIVGEIWLKTPRAAQGYLNDAEATQATFNATLAHGEQGFLRTGDLGFVEQGQLYIVGREKDVIAIHGKKYHSVDLELALYQALEGQYPDQLTANHLRLPCAVFSQEQAERETVIVVQEITAATQPACAELAASIVGVISEKFQIGVTCVSFVPPGTIPQTGSKKIRRKLCKQQFLAGSLTELWRFHGSHPSTESNLALSSDHVLQLLKVQVLLPELGEVAHQLDEQRPFSQLGLDSIKYIRLARKVEQTFGIPFKPGMFYTYLNCRQLADYLRTQQKLPGRPNAQDGRWQAYRDPGVVKLLKDCVRGKLSIEDTLGKIKERL